MLNQNNLIHPSFREHNSKEFYVIKQSNNFKDKSFGSHIDREEIKDKYPDSDKEESIGVLYPIDMIQQRLGYLSINHHKHKKSPSSHITRNKRKYESIKNKQSSITEEVYPDMYKRNKATVKKQDILKYEDNMVVIKFEDYFEP